MPDRKSLKKDKDGKDQMILTTTEGQRDLPRYFTPVFDKLKALPRGRLDITLPDGRHFRVEGKDPGYVAQLDVHDPEVFARLIREGDLPQTERAMARDFAGVDQLLQQR